MARGSAWEENSGADIVALAAGGSTTTIDRAAVSGKKHFVRKVIVTQTDSGQVVTYRVYEGDVNGTLVIAVSPRASGVFEIDLGNREWPANTAVTVEAEAIGAANNVCLYMDGYTLNA